MSIAIPKSNGKVSQNDQTSNISNKVDVEKNDSENKDLCPFNYKYIGGLIFAIVCVLFSALDVGSDIYLGYIYFVNNQYWHGGLTLLFVYVASFANVCEFYRRKTFNNQKNWIRWISLSLMFITSTPAVIMGGIDFWTKLKRKESSTSNETLNKLRYHEACVEAAPQLILQISVLLNNLHELENFNVSLFVLVQRISILSSFVIITLAFGRVEIVGVEGICKKFLFYLSMFLTIGPRILALAILFNLYPLYTLPVLFIPVVVHVLLYYLLEGEKNWTLLSFVPLASLIFTWLPLAVTNKWYQILPYSVCVVVQNLTASVLWITEKKDSFLYELLPVICLYPYIVGILLSSLFFDRIKK